MGAITSTILAATAIGAGIWGISQAGKRSKSAAAKPAAIMPMPAPPKVEVAAAQAQATAKSKKRAIARSRSIYTSPLGIGGEAQITRKVLLGQ